MNDRQPTPGQEGRVLLTPEDGSPPFYAKMEMADNPLDPGTPLCKLTLLSDEACDFLDIPRTSVPSDAFIKLTFGTKKYGYRVTLMTAGGRPASGVTIKGIELPGGGTCVTDDNGQTFGVAADRTTISVSSPYLDCEDISVDVVSSSVITNVTLKFSRVKEPKTTIEQSADFYFSADVQELDACAIGAGSNGYYFKASAVFSGGGGSIENRYALPYSGQMISVVVGAPGNNGGDTVISGLSGEDIIGEGPKGFNLGKLTPAQSKNGGNGIFVHSSNSEDGNDRTEYPFGDESIKCSGGGGIGGGYSSSGVIFGGQGGDSGGGNGGFGGYDGTVRPAMNGQDGLYYGSGGGSPGYGYGGVHGEPGSGKSGAAMFRWRYKA